MTTIDDVAKLAGVSKTTVSNVLTGKGTNSLKTRQHVMRIISEIGYRPSMVASSLKTQQTYTAALIIPNITNLYYAIYARGFQDQMESENYDTFICSTDDQPKRLQGFVAKLVQRRVDGIAIASFHDLSLELQLAQAHQVAVVMMGPYSSSLADPNIDLVASDGTGVEKGIRYLASRGHSRIGMISESLDNDSGLGRVVQYQQIVAQLHLDQDPALIVSSNSRYAREGGVLAMERLMRLPQPPTAVFCNNDVIAIGALDAARMLGLHVPNDVAVMGFNDIVDAALTSPKLTTVNNLGAASGEKVAQLLLDRMKGTYTGPARVVLTPHYVVVRESA